MGNVTEIKSEEEFREFIAQDKAVVNFTAPAWCGPCRALEPRYTMAASQTDVPFATVNADDFSDLLGEYLVMSVPTVIKFEKSNVICGIGGRTAPSILAEL